MSNYIKGKQKCRNEKNFISCNLLKRASVKISGEEVCLLISFYLLSVNP